MTTITYINAQNTSSYGRYEFVVDTLEHGKLSAQSNDARLFDQFKDGDDDAKNRICEFVLTENEINEEFEIA